MFILFSLLLSLYALYCICFCSMLLHTAIIEEWWCKNKYNKINSNVNIV